MKANEQAVIIRGLADANDELLRSETVRIGYIKELARLSVERESLPELFTADGSAGELSDGLKLACSVVGDGEDGGIFARLAFDLYRHRFGELTEALIFPESADGLSSASFVSGSGADSAFELFRQNFSRRLNLTAIHTGRTSAACDAVLDGDADACILPVRSRTDGRLGSFYRMIDVYGLKIGATVTVRSSENEMRYALCRRASLPLTDSPTHIEFSVPCDGEGAVRLIKAAEAQELTLFEISSYPSERGGEIFSFVFRIGQSYKPFLLYLKLFHPKFSLIGIYSEVNE